MISQIIENTGIPTALITTLVPIAEFSGAYRIVPACGIDRPLGAPEQPPHEEKALRLKIVLKALEALETDVTGTSVFNWNDGLDG